MTDPAYPIGSFQVETDLTEARRQALIRDIEEAPANLRKALGGLAPEQLDTAYRVGGWTVRQVVHHLADSHLNAYVRFRLALTEDQPTIKPYDQVLWAELSDAKSAPVEPSLALLDALHRRWVLLLRALPPQGFRRTIQHPERGVLNLDANLALYAWHGRHHTAQILFLRDRMGWK